MIGMPSNLQHYLATHLAGAAAATSMMRSLAERLDADDLRGIITELLEEQHLLRAVADQMDMSPSVVSRVAAIAGEVGSRAVRRAQGVIDPHLRNLAELEAMLTGIHGKKALWRLLRELVDAHPPLADLDHEGLLVQADRQEGVIESHRIAQGLRALS